MAEKVLVIGDDNRSFLSSVRSLGRLGLEVHVAPEDWSSPSLSSRYITRRISLPPHDLSPDDWIEALLRVHARERYSFILPCNEKGILPLMRHQDRFGDTALGIVNGKAFDTFFDKIATRACAQEVGVPIAKGRAFTPQDCAADLIGEFGLPLAVKPSRSFVDENLFSRRTVQLVHSQDALFHALSKIDHWDGYFVEAIFPGSGAGLSVLARDGEVLQAFQHQRVHEPERGGGSSYRMSVPIDADMMDDVEKLCRATNLTGLSMFEFRRNPATGERILLEVNARLWGSVPLAISAGIDFPALYYQMLTGKPIAPKIKYKTPIYARNVVNDLNSVVDRAVMLASAPRPASIAGFAGYLGTYWRYLAGLDASDTRAEDDPRPHRKGISAFKSGFSGRIASKVRTMRLRQTMAEKTQLKQDLAQLPACPTLAVICRGNICRSPFAARLLKRKAAARGLDITVVEGGTLPRGPRPSPAPALEAALAYDVDLKPHRSQHVSKLDWSAIDMILHFDPIIAQELHYVLRRVDAPIFNLAHMAPGGDDSHVITDPVHGEVEQFNDVYGDIDIALDRFLDAYSAAASSLRPAMAGTS